MKTVRQTLFKRGEGHSDRYSKDHCNRVLQRGKETGLNSKYSVSKEKFITKKQIQGQVDGKILRENCRGRGDSGQTNLTGRQARVVRYYLGNGGG